nr:hypothetical protein [Streptomyces sp. TLI_235]
MTIASGGARGRLRRGIGVIGGALAAFSIMEILSKAAISGAIS